MMDLQVRLGSEGGYGGKRPTLGSRKGQVCWKRAPTFSSTFSWQVEEFRHRRDFCKIRLLFRSNPYFHNQVIVKEYVIHITGKRRLRRRGLRVVYASGNLIRPFSRTSLPAGYKASHATPIRWYPHYACEAYGLRHQPHSPNFFNWVSDHRCAGSGKIAEVGYPRSCPKEVLWVSAPLGFGI